MSIIIANNYGNLHIANIKEFKNNQIEDNLVVTELVPKLNMCEISVQKATSPSDLLLSYLNESVIDYFGDVENSKFSFNSDIDLNNLIVIASSLKQSKDCTQSLQEDLVSSDFSEKYFNVEKKLDYESNCDFSSVKVEANCITCKDFCEQIAASYLIKFDEIKVDSPNYMPEFNLQNNKHLLRDINELPIEFKQSYLDLYKSCSKKEIDYDKVIEHASACKVNLSRYLYNQDFNLNSIQDNQTKNDLSVQNNSQAQSDHKSRSR